MAPTLGLIDISLSLSTTTSGVFRWPAWFSASKATPPVSAPSPSTQTTCPRRSRASLAASTMPSP